MEKQQLVNKCIGQIKNDLINNYYGPIEGLLMSLDEDTLKGFLPDDDDQYFYYPMTVEFVYEGNAFKYTIVPEESDWWESDGKFDYHYCEDYNQVCVYLVDGDMFCQTMDSKPIHSQPIRNVG